MNTPQSKAIHAPRRFYFLDYFYILLKSVQRYKDKDSIFDSFKILKKQHRLGESKYKPLVVEDENLTKTQLDRYRYTFEQVIEEASDYKLVREPAAGYLSLADQGRRLLKLYEEKGSLAFNQELCKLMESQYNAFRDIIELLYRANEFKSGLIFLPVYSPRQLGLERSQVRTTEDIMFYASKLVERLETDIQKYLGQHKYLGKENAKIVTRLIESNLLNENPKAEFAQAKYNVIIKRFRDYWITYFLRDVYGYRYSLTSFETWAYRAKQIGIMHATEFFPNFNGRIIYPTSVIVRSTRSSDFKLIYRYRDGTGLYAHEPGLEANQDKFVDSLVNGYFSLRGRFTSYFINLSSLREVVCYSMKISEYLFEKFLQHVYRLNLAGELKIRISLEVDRLPEETTATHLKREPVMVDGRKRNIIAIDVAKERLHEPTLEKAHTLWPS
jgi:hypothetical protein